jgi:aspartokinase/homoserine dehydrogenase 1
VVEAEKTDSLVMKFGGTSVGSAAAMRQASTIIQDARLVWPRLVVVTSALAGVTDLLLGTAQSAAAGDLSSLPTAERQLRGMHGIIAEELISRPVRRQEVVRVVQSLITGFSELCRAIAVLGESTPRALDAVASLGERMSVRVLAAVLEDHALSAEAVDATQLIITDDHFQNAHPDIPATSARVKAVLGPLMDRGVVPVVTGFLGATRSGAVTTLGRGGSDYTAAILGATLPAADVWIWSDVDGVMTADPQVVPDARTLAEISYEEVAELAYFGAKVLHPRTIRPVIEAQVNLRICNTFNPTHPGTRLVRTRADSTRGDGRVIRAVTAISQQCLVTIEGRGMLGVPGVAARAFGAVASTGTSVPLITQASSEQSICFAIPEEAKGPVLTALEATFANELSQRDIDRVWASEEVAIVTAVGSGARYTPGVAGQIFGQLGRDQINVLAIAHGSSDVSMSLVVTAADAGRAVRTLHEIVSREVQQ